MDIFVLLIVGFVLLLCVGFAIYFIYYLCITIYRKTLRYDTFSSTAQVCYKEYEEEYSTTSFIHVDKVLVPHTQEHDEEYKVYLMFEDKEYVFDDENLYKEVNVGDSIRVTVHKGYNKKDELKHVYLSIDD